MWCICSTEILFQTGNIVAYIRISMFIQCSSNKISVKTMQTKPRKYRIILCWFILTVVSRFAQIFMFLFWFHVISVFYAENRVACFPLTFFEIQLRSTLLTLAKCCFPLDILISLIQTTTSIYECAKWMHSNRITSDWEKKKMREWKIIQKPCYAMNELNMNSIQCFGRKTIQCMNTIA